MNAPYSHNDSFQWLMDRESYGPDEALRRMQLNWARQAGLIGETAPEPPDSGTLLGAIGKRAIGAVTAIIARIGSRPPALQDSAGDA